MENELIAEKKIWKSNWFWLSVSAVIFIIGFITSQLGRDMTSMGEVYSNPILVETAILKANNTPEVIAHFGKLAPLKKLAILEGSVIKTKEYISITVKVVGGKSNGKMDIVGNNINKLWKYQSIEIRDQVKNVKIKVPVD